VRQVERLIPKLVQGGAHGRDESVGFRQPRPARVANEQMLFHVREIRLCQRAHSVALQQIV
jgi:hypothetical protein